MATTNSLYVPEAMLAADINPVARNNVLMTSNVKYANISLLLLRRKLPQESHVEARKATDNWGITIWLGHYLGRIQRVHNLLI